MNEQTNKLINLRKKRHLNDHVVTLSLNGAEIWREIKTIAKLASITRRAYLLYICN